MPNRSNSPLAGLLDPGSSVAKLAQEFERADKELYLVGGSVRDAFLGRPHWDLDFATNARPDEIHRIVEPLATAVWLQGAEFGTVGAEIEGLPMEITTFRTERYSPQSRRPQVTYADDITVDLSRRDFTINALAIKLPDRAPVDPFGGLRDLKARVLKTPIAPAESFSDDPLRMLRAFRFVSQLSFAIDSSALVAIEEGRDQLRTVSAERIRDELTKLLLGAAPATALDLADRTGVTDIFLPELGALKLEQDPVHRHKDVFKHTLVVVERTDAVLELRLAALLHDIGKPKTRRITPEGVSFHHHEVAGSEMAKNRLRALRYRNEVVEAVGELIRLHHRFHTFALGWSDSAVRRYVRDAGALLEQLNALVRADCTTRNPTKARGLAARMDELDARIQELSAKEELQRIRPELDGRQVMAYLGVPPGPVVGRALAHLLEIRLEEGLIGTVQAYERLDAWAREQGMTPVGEKIPAVSAG
jgi:poly(A) polymerase